MKSGLIKFLFNHILNLRRFNIEKVRTFNVSPHLTSFSKTFVFTQFTRCHHISYLTFSRSGPIQSSLKVAYSAFLLATPRLMEPVMFGTSGGAWVQIFV